MERSEPMVPVVVERRSRVVLLLSIVIAATRLLAVAHSMFDWDEGLFSLGVRDYDVAQHHPHPPGYPLFVAAAKLVHVVVHSEFRAVQVVVVLASFFLFPALFWLAREIGFDFATSVSGAAIFSFLPNVWIYSGTAFSDVPGAVVMLAACALLLRGRRDSRAYLLGALALGIAAGIRPAALLVGFVPAVIATYDRGRESLRAVVLGILLGGAVAGGSYVGAAVASHSVDAYRDAVRQQSKWVHDIDSWHNPGRPPLSEAAHVFFIAPVEQKQQMTGLALLGLVGIAAAVVRRRPAPLLTLALFAPLAVVSWLNLDIAAAGRYAISYMPAHALLAAEGIGVLASMPRWRAMAIRVQALFTALVCVVFAVWTWPALGVQRSTDSPPVAALRWIRDHVAKTTTVYVHGGVGPQSAVLLADREVTYYDDDAALAHAPNEAWIVDLKVVPHGMNFVRPHGSLWKILRRRNFEASVSAKSNVIDYGQGWFAEETDGEHEWRWMGREATASMPPMRTEARLSMRLYVPIDSMLPPTIEIHLNGTRIDRFVGSSAVLEKSWLVRGNPAARNELRIVTSATVNPSRVRGSSDFRDLGLRVDELTWLPPWDPSR